MLYAHAYAFALHTLDIGCGNLSRKVRILAIVLKVTSAERIAMDIDTRTEDYITVILLCLVTYSLTYSLRKVGVPCRGKTSADREARGIISFLSSRASRIYTYTCRAIGEDGLWNTQTLYGYRCSGCSRYGSGSSTCYCNWREEIV